MTVKIWDSRATARKAMITVKAHTSDVNCLTWNKYDATNGIDVRSNQLISAGKLIICWRLVPTTAHSRFGILGISNRTLISVSDNF